jgi:hypothetical protein
VGRFYQFSVFSLLAIFLLNGFSPCQAQEVVAPTSEHPATLKSKKEGIGQWLFHKLIEGKPLPITRIGPDSDRVEPGAEKFAMYREGQGGKDQFISLVCDFGVTEMFVLSGNGSQEEQWNQELKGTRCANGKPMPNFTVKFGTKPEQAQKTKTPLTKKFLSEFDQWVKDARDAKPPKKIAFRCNCGCHRTGRLAGYSDMKFFGATPEAALKRMADVFEKNPDLDADDPQQVKGKALAKHYAKRSITQQVYALNDFIHGVPCSTRPQYCVDAPGKKTKSNVASDPQKFDAVFKGIRQPTENQCADPESDSER